MGGRFSRRPRKPQGIYRRCRRGALGLSSCPGFTLTKNGVQVPHARCGGDGWIKIGEKGKPRKKGRGRPKRGSRRRKVATYLGGCAAFVVAGEQMFGTVGSIAATVLVVVFTVLRVAVLVMRLSGASS